ncbi:DUF262 domain-containing protein [Elizabethkingia ursingii]|uniref:DUF262 domain-containing protein n=1 Tax=Elizabethkingia ursingii TaxID=1756150 RepID=UPI002011D781|nr:DUF262 domain-containing protein [Elizabethkingia ursingii]MCL1670776.1 DUF262 domain-containing HNH endonuclease family protein [Elizabethkingia ursingii]
MKKIFDTAIVNLESLNSYNFSIPTYQRPYVWGVEQIKKLLDDFYLSFQSSTDAEYYVSTFLTKENGELAELIDGQQRFTTLWIIAFVMSTLNSESDIETFLKKDDKLRLGFEIRKEVSDYLENLIDNKADKKNYDEKIINEYPYLKNIAKAITFVKAYIEQLKLSKVDLQHFGNFIYRNVKLIKNTTPDNTDLNKLFSTINSAGIQLEQTDIVKANLLKFLDDKIGYGKIWEACENMNNFFERNVRLSFPETDKKNIDLTNMVSFDRNIFLYEKSSNAVNAENLFSIDNLLYDQINDYNALNKKNDNEQKRKDSDEIFCRSIISFGQLLLHTYRIHLKKEKRTDFNGTFHVNRLIEIFNELAERKDKEEIKRFFHLLWDIRYLFDKYIVKWISDIDTKSESLELLNYNKNEEGYYSRTKYQKSSSLMLQSVLYFTGDYLRQYWLTSYLGYLEENHNNITPTANDLLLKLEEIDNSFSLNNSLTDKEISWMHINKENINPDFDFQTYFNGSDGTGFKHYWFQKLEYILWKNWEDKEDEKYKKYKITSKNSVEHIYPQNPENRIQHPEIHDNDLHSFGNLVLLSVSQNSEYSNKSVSVKKSMFQEKTETYDTLKSFHIFKDQIEWNTNAIANHKDKMIALIKKHYNYAITN